jgi:hypothetical protein
MRDGSCLAMVVLTILWEGIWYLYCADIAKNSAEQSLSDAYCMMWILGIPIIPIIAVAMVLLTCWAIKRAIKIR